jgi:Flp pilus assembly protein TadD
MRLSYLASITCSLSVLLFLSSCKGSAEKTNSTDSDRQFGYLQAQAAAHPDSISLQIKWAETLISKGDTAAAIDALLSLNERKPDQTETLNALAYASLIAHDTSSAAYHLEQSLGLLPNQPAIEMELAFLHLARNQDQWIAMVNNMIQDKQDPIRASRGHFIKGVSLSNQNQLPNAIRSFDSSIVLNFTFIDAHIERSILLLEQKKAQSAAEGLFKALEMERKSPDLYFLLGEAHMQLNKPAEARNFYLQAVELDPTHQGAQKQLKKISTQKNP